MKCGGRGVCGCGAAHCAENLWWFQFGLLWWLVAYEMLEERRGRWASQLQPYVDDADSEAA
jgi:hypothetical protein